MLTGHRWSVYDVHERIGVGGMGEVYRARDTRLGRDVALKILPLSFAADPERLARFEREARLLAAINHPRIAAIYELEEADGVRGLVLELVEGPTLAQLLAAGPMPFAAALQTACQIAEALEVAHERGILHRDLKPANIKIARGGGVKVLDFGLAKHIGADTSTAALSDAPTISSLATRQGMLLGTPAYMSPEQARGEAVDKRADIWAFGCVLYEMLTGRGPFAGNTVFDTIGAVLEREPDWARLPPTASPALRVLLKRCLEKDPSRRLRDVGDARLELDGTTAESAREAPRTGNRFVWMALAAGLAIGAIAIWPLMSAGSHPPAVPPTRFTFAAPDLAPRMLGAPAVSPDGRQIAFAAGNAAGEMHLWIRSLDSPTPRRIEGTDGARSPFWSPDARFIGFGAPNQGRLKTVDLSTGNVQNITIISDALEGATWSTKGVILFSPDNRVVLHQVSAFGGTSQPVTVLDPARRENSHRWPHFLPDGRHFLFTARSDVRENTGIYVGTLDSAERTWLVEAQSSAAYAAPGYLLFVREGTLLAQPFDATTRRLSGEPVVVAANVAQETTAARALSSVSLDASIVAYRSASDDASELTWFDRRGEKVGAAIGEGAFEDVRLAPDGAHAAVTMTDRDTGNRDIWNVDLANAAMTRVTSHPANDWKPTWSPDGTRLAFASDRQGSSTLMHKAADGSGPEVAIPIAAVPGHLFPNDWFPDGQRLAVHSSTPETTLDVWVVSRDGGDAQEIARSRYQEHSARISPDGRWVAFVSDESGAPEVYVQPVGRGAKRRVSTSGGVGPRWRRDGRELFFVDRANRLTALAVGSSETFSPSAPVTLFTVCGTSTPEFYMYEVAGDGSRSLWICPSPRRPPSLVTVSIASLPLGKEGR